MDCTILLVCRHRAKDPAYQHKYNLLIKKQSSCAGSSDHCWHKARHRPLHAGYLQSYNVLVLVVSVRPMCQSCTASCLHQQQLTRHAPELLKVRPLDGINIISRYWGCGISICCHCRNLHHGITKREEPPSQLTTDLMQPSTEEENVEAH